MYLLCAAQTFLIICLFFAVSCMIRLSSVLLVHCKSWVIFIKQNIKAYVTVETMKCLLVWIHAWMRYAQTWDFTHFLIRRGVFLILLMAMLVSWPVALLVLLLKISNRLGLLAKQSIRQLPMPLVMLLSSVAFVLIWVIPYVSSLLLASTIILQPLTSRTILALLLVINIMGGRFTTFVSRYL